MNNILNLFLSATPVVIGGFICACLLIGKGIFRIKNIFNLVIIVLVIFFIIGRI